MNKIFLAALGATTLALAPARALGLGEAYNPGYCAEMGPNLPGCKTPPAQEALPASNPAASMATFEQMAMSALQHQADLDAAEATRDLPAQAPPRRARPAPHEPSTGRAQADDLAAAIDNTFPRVVNAAGQINALRASVLPTAQSASQGLPADPLSHNDQLFDKRRAAPSKTDTEAKPRPFLACTPDSPCGRPD